MANIGDVARHLGVSRSTVSYALSGKRSISSEMRKRVADAIEELAYYPSATGRALATARTETLALLAPMAENVTPQVALQFVHGVVQAARSFGYDILLVSGDEAFSSVERLERGKQVDGFVVLDVEENDPRVKALRDSGAACCLVGMPHGTVDLDCVDLDWGTAGFTLLGALTQQGHRSVALIGAPSIAHELGMTYAARFREGVETAASQRGVSVTEVASSGDYFDTAAATRRLLQSEPAITGIIVQHEASVAPVFAALRTMKADVPRDYSVVAISIDRLGPNFAPPTAGVINSSSEVTRTAVSMLIERLAHPSSETRTILVDPEYVDLPTVASPRAVP